MQMLESISRGRRVISSREEREHYKSILRSLPVNIAAPAQDRQALVQVDMDCPITETTCNAVRCDAICCD